MVRIAAKSTIKTEEKILATVEKMNQGLKVSLQEMLRSQLGREPHLCNEPENWVRSLHGVSAELSQSARWNRRELKTLGSLSSYCQQWLVTARA